MEWRIKIWGLYGWWVTAKDENWNWLKTEIEHGLFAKEIIGIRGT
jgi:hypothetical protein